jgi:hypothetical protein
MHTRAAHEVHHRQARGGDGAHGLHHGGRDPRRRCVARAGRRAAAVQPPLAVLLVGVGALPTQPRGRRVTREPSWCVPPRPLPAITHANTRPRTRARAHTHTRTRRRRPQRDAGLAQRERLLPAHERGGAGRVHGLLVLVPAQVRARACGAAARARALLACVRACVAACGVCCAGHLRAWRLLGGWVAGRWRVALWLLPAEPAGTHSPPLESTRCHASTTAATIHPHSHTRARAHTHTHTHTPLTCRSYFLSLALTPSALIGLDGELRPPRLELACACKPSMFAYAPPVTTGACAFVAVERVGLSAALGVCVCVACAGRRVGWTSAAVATAAACRPFPNAQAHARTHTLDTPPLATHTEATKEVAKVAKAVLSTTAKARERQKKKDAEKAAAAAGGKDGKDGKPSGAYVRACVCVCVCVCVLGGGAWRGQCRVCVCCWSCVRRCLVLVSQLCHTAVALHASTTPKTATQAWTWTRPRLPAARRAARTALLLAAPQTRRAAPRRALRAPMAATAALRLAAAARRARRRRRRRSPAATRSQRPAGWCRSRSST